MAIVQARNKLYKNKAKTAKLNRDIFKSIGTGTLNLSPSCIHIMTNVAKYIDGIDGRIYVDMEQVRKDLFMQPETFKRAITELSENGLLLFANGYYYSRFHVLSNGKDEFYQKMLTAYTSPEVLNLTKNQLRLFYYVATMGMVGMWKAVNVENLYKNFLHDTRYGIQYFDSYRDFAEALFELIKKGLVSVWLVNSKKYVEKNTPQFKEVFHTYCEHNTAGRKKRTSAKRMHKIALKINESIANEVSDNCANEAEFDYFAEQYQIVHQFIKIETKRYFIGLKNKLTETLGATGLAIYRSALEAYFCSNEEKVLYHDFINKAANYFKDFYLLEEVKKIIVGALASECGFKGALSSAVDYPVEKDSLDKLVSFFGDEASSNHLICLDAEIEKQGISWLKVINKDKDFWRPLYDGIQEIYSIYTTSIVTKAYVRSFAKEGLLTQKEELEEVVNSLKKNLSFIPLYKTSKLVATQNTESTSAELRSVLFDNNGKLVNWLGN
ncbi:MAG TPA: hypothetical protein GXX18_06070 [Bacillales bacterium]|nr:hypothetical protein [Bacillales bacterium]